MLEQRNKVHPDRFEERHLSAHPSDIQAMLSYIGVTSLDELIDQTLPQEIRLEQPLRLPEALTESGYLSELSHMASKNKQYDSYIGLGYYGARMPGVIQRNILENPGWYTQYTPYQAEIAQGRLEALLNFQTMVADLTGMEVAGASLLDESTAAAEAMHLCYHVTKKQGATLFLVSEHVFPQTIEVLKGHAEPLGIEIKVIKDNEFSSQIPMPSVFGLLVQYPNARGSIQDWGTLVAEAHAKDVLVAFAADLLSLTLLTPPGHWNADVVIGSTQRFGLPLGYGGPHAAYFATREDFKRTLPGRIIGVSVDSAGHRALRMALQTREQHIRRDKATSNICTAQALPAILASMYSVYHGPSGLCEIARKITYLAHHLAEGLQKGGFQLKQDPFFDTVFVVMPEMLEQQVIRDRALSDHINFYYSSKGITISLDERSSQQSVEKILKVFIPEFLAPMPAANELQAGAARKESMPAANGLETAALGSEITSLNSPEAQFFWSAENGVEFPEGLKRTTAFMQHPVFNSYHTEHEMLRYMKRLENKDLSLAHSMIPLGSCTMKLNATTEMIPLSWAGWNSIHPFVPVNQTLGYQELFRELESALCEITGFYSFSLQPNSGAQGEYSGLRVIRAYHQSRGDWGRNLVLIPSSAHGTNPASAVMAGFRVMVVACDEKGNIDLADLSQKARENHETLGALMVTYPSTHGVFEVAIQEICAIIHQYGGQVYMDGANMNAQVGLTSPVMIGADVCHLNLHKTFCIPHGGGGPGMGPIGVAQHLSPFLPGHSLVHIGGEKAIQAVSEAPWGSASILIISHAYIRLMGGPGLTRATVHAILNANYIKKRLEPYYPVLYSGAQGRSAHELILDCRSFKAFGIEVSDMAKRLMDFGLHAPTVSFPVAGTLMIEPTESESLAEIDRYCEALIQIRHEIQEVEQGRSDKMDNVLKNAPHTAEHLLEQEWSHAYSRKKAAYPLPWVRERKFWPSVGRINETHGDRIFICTCPPMEEYMEENSVLNLYE